VHCRRTAFFSLREGGRGVIPASSAAGLAISALRRSSGIRGVDQTSSADRWMRIAPRSSWAERLRGTVRGHAPTRVARSCHRTGPQHLLRLIRAHIAYYNEDRPIWHSLATRPAGARWNHPVQVGSLCFRESVDCIIGIRARRNYCAIPSLPCGRARARTTLHGRPLSPANVRWAALASPTFRQSPVRARDVFEAALVRLSIPSHRPAMSIHQHNQERARSVVDGELTERNGRSFRLCPRRCALSLDNTQPGRLN